MASTYVNDLRLNELGTGDASGTWGTITNLNLELIGEGLSYGTQDCFTTNADATTTVADGASDPARAMYFKVTSSATLTATRTLTIAPNTVSRLQYIENATTGGQSINISQGSGANVTIPSGATKAVYLDGAGSGAAVTDAFANFSAGTITASLTGTASNANQLDSLDSTQFLRSDAADTKTSGNLKFNTNVRAEFGTTTTLSIYSDGTTSVISEEGAGTLNIDGSNLRLRDTNGNKYLEAVDTGIGGTVTLFHNEVAKLATKSDGIDITGELQADSLDIDGVGNISGTLTLSANLDMQDGDIIVMGNSNDLQIQHSGSNGFIDHDGDGSLYLRQRGTDKDIILQSDNGSGGDTDYILCDGSTGQVVLYHYGSSKLKTTSTGIDVTGTGTNSNISVTVADDGSANAPDIFLYRNSASPAANDGIGNLTFRGNDTASNDTTYASIEGYIASPTNGSEQGRISFFLNHNNSINEEFRMESDGDFHADGDVIAFSTTISDERLKTDIEKIENATDKVSQLNGYTFTYKADGVKSAGVIAQEVEKVLPSAVREKELPLKSDDGVAYKTVQYDQIIGLLIESIKELKQEINELKGA
jgi:hypothetical protein